MVAINLPVRPTALGAFQSLLVCLGVLYWLSPTWMRGTDERIAGEPFRVLGIDLAVIAFVASHFIPLLGTWVFMFLLHAGTGALTVELRRRLSALPVAG